MRCIKITSVFIGIVLASVVWAAFAPSDWQFRKPISVSGSGYLRLNLDAEAFAGLQPDLRDLRVVDGTGTETPFKIVVERTGSDVRTRRLTLFNNAYTPGQFQSFIVRIDTPPGQLHNWLRLVTPEQEFQKQVEIAGSDDQQSWQVLKSDGYIFGHIEPRRGFAAKETSLTYPASTFRYLRVRIFSDAPFPVTGVEVTEQVSASVKEVTFSPALSSVEDREHQTTEVTLDFGQTGLPTRELTLATGAVNFNRPAELYVSNDNQSWRPLGSGYLFRVAQPKFSGQNLTINYPETAARYLRISVYNGDDQPISFTGATARGTLRSVVFNANPGASYFLYYGNAGARYPDYDIERLLPYLEVPAQPGATLGAQQVNPVYVAPAPPVVPFTERLPWLLPSILVVVALGLLALMFQFVKRVKP